MPDAIQEVVGNREGQDKLHAIDDDGAQRQALDNLKVMREIARQRQKSD